MAGLVAGYLLLVNLLTFLTFGHDKRAAIGGERRVPEANLLMLALLGGSPGALAARRVFRHKTRKEPFATLLLSVVAIQIGLIAGYFLI